MPTRVRLVRFLRLLEVEVLVTSMRLIRHPLRAVPRMRQEPLGPAARIFPRVCQVGRRLVSRQTRLTPVPLRSHVSEGRG